jgi:SAM-dependent methyltransferase
VACPICRNHSSVLKYINISKARNVLLCPKCGHWYLDPMPQSAERRTFYEGNYYERWEYNNDTSVAIGDIKKLLYRSILEKLVLSPGAKVLDIGCAMAFSLEVAREMGYEPYGVEISEYAGKIAREKFGDNVIIGDIDLIEKRGTLFDAVTMSDLIEHVENPILTLKKVYSFVKPGGIVAIVTPDNGSFTAKLMLRAWPHIKEEHLHYFSLGSISESLALSGFTVLNITPMPKPIYLSYAKNVAKCSSSPILYNILRAICAITPKTLLEKIFYIPMGEMLIIAKK